MQRKKNGCCDPSGSRAGNRCTAASDIHRTAQDRCHGPGSGGNGLARRPAAGRCRGGNGIAAEYNVGRFFVDVEALYSYEGTFQMQNLIVGKAITGLSAFV